MQHIVYAVVIASPQDRGGRQEAGCMRIAVAGGGPGGLYFAALVRQLLPDALVTV
jgi:NADH dehydrogenase FAD-containing subunit